MNRPNTGESFTKSAFEQMKRRHGVAPGAKNMTVIVDARYAKPQDAIIVRLNTGSTFIVPRTRLPGFEKIEPVALRKPEIEAPGNALWFNAPDIGVRLETLMIAAAGEGTVRSAAAQLLGSRKSAHKASSSAANGKLGGRPRKGRLQRLRDLNEAYNARPSFDPADSPDPCSWLGVVRDRIRRRPRVARGA